MTAQILQFPERKRHTGVMKLAPGQGTAAMTQSVVSEYDCHMMDAIRAKAEACLDVTRIERKALDGFLHSELKLGSEFTFGSRKFRLTFQVEDLTPPKSYA